MITDDVRTLASELTDRLNQVNPNAFSSLDPRRGHEELRLAATRIATLTGSASVDYVDFTRGSEQQESLGDQIIAFTTHALIVIDVEQMRSDFPGSTKVIPRTDITSLDLVSLPSILDERSAERWPGYLQVAVTYSDDFTATFPLQQNWWPAHKQEFALLIPSLVEDLNRRP